jgi:hypothetical protein
VSGQETEADEQVRLPTAHRLLEMEDGLGGDSREAGDAFGDQILHALGDVRLLEEGFAIPLSVNQLIQLLDLIAESDLEGVGLELTGIAHGFHSTAVLSMADKSMDFGSRGVAFTKSAQASAVVGESQAVSLFTQDTRHRSMRCIVQSLRL